MSVIRPVLMDFSIDTTSLKVTKMIWLVIGEMSLKFREAHPLLCMTYMLWSRFSTALFLEYLQKLITCFSLQLYLKDYQLLTEIHLH